MDTIFTFTGSEKDIENHIVENIQDICNNCFFGDVKKCIQSVKLKSAVGSGIFDIVVYHTDNSATLIEVKKYKDEVQLSSAIGQILFYGEICSAVLGNYPRMIIACNYIPTSIIAVVKSNKLPIKLLQVDGDKVTFI